MIEIQCPNCGEYVSDELDSCPFCYASLDRQDKDSGDDEKLTQPEGEPVIDDVADGGDDEKESSLEDIPAAPAGNQPVSSSEKEVTDWLSGLEQTANEEDKAPAWLSNIKDLVKKDKQPETSEGDENDWLDSLRDGSEEKTLDLTEEAPDSASEEPISQEGIPEWMKKLQEDVDSRNAPSKLVQASQPAEENSETPDWLLRLKAETQAYAAAQDNSLSAREEETPDLTGKENTGISGSPDVSIQPDGEAPDWTKNLQAESGKFAAEDDFSDEGIPDSLRKIQAEEPASEESAIPVEDETPDWMKDIQDEPLLSKVDGAPAGSSSTDWLSDFREDTPVSEEGNAVPAEEIPDWLKDVGSESSSTTAEVNQSASDANTATEELTSNGGEPDWLINLKAEGEASQQEAGGQLKTPLEAHQDGLELVPGWLQDSDKSEPLSSEKPVQVQDQQGSSSDGSGTLPSGDLPDWLSAMKSDAEAPETGNKVPLVEQRSDAIQPADLPSWVQAMQPAEAIVADAEVLTNDLSQITENDGPLAGLSGVLPASPGFGNPQKPLSFSVKLRVTEDQQQRASQLDNILADENKAKPVISTSRNIKNQVLRWVISLLVILSVAVPAFSGFQKTPGLSTTPPEILATSQVIFGLPHASPVLLVFDYEPAYSGELEATAAPLVSNLFLTGARVAILSTSPTGPALAEYFLKNTQGQVAFQGNQQSTNLGYLAGGASGVLSFATNPSQTLPNALDGSQPWQTPLLQDVHTLADFAAVIILTDNSDTARIWVEQAGPLLGGKPMLMAISAQAEPMIRPYYESNQIKGLVTGLSGGKAYEQALQLPGLAARYWDSFSMGLFIAELIIILASLWSIFSILRDHKPAQKEEE